MINVVLYPPTFSVPQGASRQFRCTVRVDGLLLDLTGAKLYFTVKPRLGDVAYVLMKRSSLAGGSDAEIEILTPQTGAGAVTGQFKLKLAPGDTTPLSWDAAFVCDLWVVTAAGDHYQVVAPGGFAVLPTVTTDIP